MFIATFKDKNKEKKFDDEVEARVIERLDVIDVEQVYRETLCDIYGMVDVCGMKMSAAAILEEMDNTAFRCGCNDWMDGEQIEEINGEHYDQREVDDIREEVYNEMTADE
jgi:hypothetical protein